MSSALASGKRSSSFCFTPPMSRRRSSGQRCGGFARYLDEGEGVTLLRAQIALAALADLRGGGDAAVGVLTNLVDSRSGDQLSFTRADRVG